jgi:hypothetical protein
MIKLKRILHEDESKARLDSNLSKWMDLNGFNRAYGIEEMIQDLKANSKNPKLFDNIDISKYIKIEKSLRRNVAIEFAKRITPTSSKDHMVKSYMEAVSKTYSLDTLKTVLIYDIKTILTSLSRSDKVLAIAAWKFTSKRKIVNDVKTVLASNIYSGYSVFKDRVITPALKDIGRKNGAWSEIDNELWNSYESPNTQSYDINYITSRIYAILDALL